MFRKRKNLIIYCLIAAFFCSCDEKTKIKEEEEVYYQEPIPEQTAFTNAQIIYYGDEFGEEISDSWVIKLYTDMEIDEIGNPIGAGAITQLSLNTPYNKLQKADLSYLKGMYSAAQSTGDFTPQTYNYGFLYRFDLPSGEVYIPDGTFFGKIPEGTTEYEPDLISTGKIAIQEEGENSIEIGAILVGEKFLKRYISYKGQPTIKEKAPVTVPNSTLKANVAIAPASLTQARLEDEGDIYVIGKENYRRYTLMLAQNEVDLTTLIPAGNGECLQIGFFVGWSDKVATGIPAGTYTVTTREDNKGILMSNIIPFNIEPGYPDKFTYPSGSWYWKYSNGTPAEYARIAGGTMVVERPNDGYKITLNFTDCSEPAYSITYLYESANAIPVFTR